ncbi:MAG: SDR family oxidoreductase [Myxococcales bacterium]|nr:SDR family oxidoreductase [Myxococcales bacterium]
MKTLEGKLAVVTGGSRGIGLAIARALAGAGAKVIIASRDGEACARAAASFGGEGVACDVGDPASVASLFARAEALGGCDVFVACAGVASGSLAAQVTRDELQRMLDVHYLGAVEGARAAAAQMRGKGGGAILFVTSIWGLGGASGTLAYGSAKAALAHAVKVLALEWARDGIRVNGLAPGFVETDMTADLPDAAKAKMLARVPLRRAARADEMAGPALFLCSDAASYVTGHTLVADGGERAR